MPHILTHSKFGPFSTDYSICYDRPIQFCELYNSNEHLLAPVDIKSVINYQFEKHNTKWPFHSGRPTNLKLASAAGFMRSSVKLGF